MMLVSPELFSRRLLYPTCNAAADTAFVIEQQYWFRSVSAFVAIGLIS